MLTDGPALRCRQSWATRLFLALGACLALATGAQAGDLLRGGAGGGSVGVVRPGADAVSAAQAQARANASDALARTTQAVQAVQAMQATARAAASGANNLGRDPNHVGLQLPNIPNGLTPGGLQVAPGVPANLSSPQPGEDPKLWQGALLPRQSTSRGGVNVIITQTAQQAVLTWKTFNVGRDTTVIFNQSGGTQTNSGNNWIAFNKILDPSGVPSQILGRIQADATVYLINQNGIIFGGSSQINLRSLVASSLAINDNLISRGLLNNPDSQFLFSSLALPAGSNGTPAFTPATPFTPNGQPGDVVVQAGAAIATPTSADHTGGRVALVGPNVKNSGTISTPDGQTVLAAGLQVGFAAHPSGDATLRGLDTYVGAVANGTFSAGTATNDGLIDSPRADVMMTGKTVNQLGVIQSSTSVSLNGRIDLLADYDAVGNLSTNFNNSKSTGGIRDLSPYTFLPKSSGTVTLGPGSVTQILPEWSSLETAAGTRVPLPSTIDIQGRAVHFAGNSMLLAPNANVNVSAGVWNFAAGANPQDNFAYTGGQIYLDSNAMINVAGSMDISAPMAQNLLTVQLRGSELRNSPLQRLGVLRALSLTIDIRRQGVFNGLAWVGTPLGDATGFVNVIQRPVGQMTIDGGTVNLRAGESIVMQSGSSVDVSGGWINYQGAPIQTSRVLVGGHLLDISQATPDRIYDGVYTGQFIDDSHAKYGISTTYTHALPLTGAHFEPTYSYGGNGGTVTLTAPSMALDGNLIGQTTMGPRQRTLTPALSTLSINFQKQDTSIFPYAIFSPTPPVVTFTPDENLTPAAAFALDSAGAPVALRADRKSVVNLSPELFASGGFGNLTLDNTDGSVVIPAGVDVEAPAGGSITIKGANITVGGKMAAPGGQLSFSLTNLSQATINAVPGLGLTSSPPADPSRGNFILSGDGILTTAGLVVDDRPMALTPAELPYKTAGGSITIQGFNVDLADGSVIDVSGGVAVSGTGKKTYGAGGTITIAAGQDLNTQVSVLGGQLRLGATLRGFSGSTGGTLKLQAPLVQIGGVPTLPRTLYLPPDFFSEGGFTNFSITALGAAGSEPDTYLTAFTIAPGTQIAPVAQSFVAAVGREVTLEPVLAPMGVRKPVSLTFSALGVVDQLNSLSLLTRGDFIMGAGASIRTDPQVNGTGGVTISGNTVAILGSIVAPGGTISISGKNNGAILQIIANQNPNLVLPNVDLGPHSFLSTAGTTVLVPDPRGFRTGSVLAGGTIKVSGNIVAEAGAILDVSGTSGILDLPPTYSTLGALPFRPLNGSFLGYSVVPTRIDTNGGSITLTGDQELFVDATLRGFAGGPSALGGSLSVSSGHFVLPNTQTAPTDIDLEVTQGGATIPKSFYGAGQTAIGHPVLDANGNLAAGLGHFAANTFLRGGFDSLSLGGVVDFVGPVSITARRSLNVASGGVIFADSAVQLNAPYVAIGAPFVAPLDPTVDYRPFPLNFPPTFGSGSLSVRANLIDVGNLSLQNIGQATLIADGGDIRGDGTFDVAGSIYLRAGQIYPASAVSFTIAASDPNIVIASSTLGNKTVTLASANLPPGFGIGAPLLGSTVQTINGANVTLASGANATISANTVVTFDPGGGSVVIARSGERQLPFSAGGTLSIYGSNITQGGVLRAPLGTINLGWNTTTAAPTDLITGQPVAESQQITLGRGSVTSISAVDPGTGKGLIIPYGLNLNGTSWIAPTGIDITATGVPSKGVNIGALSVSAEAGSTIDIRGGGDLYAYRFVSSNLGDHDILSPTASTTSFAIIPGYQPDYAPYAPYSTNTASDNLGSDPGYTSSRLSVGDQIYIGGSNVLRAGTYTLLPARYALLPGAILITPQAGAPLGTLSLPDGSSLVSGYVVNSLDAQRTGQPIAARFNISSADVFRQRAEYDDSLANTFLKESATALGVPLARRPVDAGRLVIEGAQALQLDGTVFAQGGQMGRNGQVGISTVTADILIGGPGTTGGANTAVLDASKLSSYGAESLLIGGYRQTVGETQSTVVVTTPNITVDNANAPLQAQDIILAATGAVTLEPGAKIAQAGGPISGLDTLLIGDPTKPGSGNGALLRVSAEAGVDVIRSGVDTSTTPTLTIGAGAVIAGTNLIIDSTRATNLSPTAELNATNIAFNSGQISIQLDNPGVLQPTAGLVLTGNALQNIENGGGSVALSSYSSIDVYGTGAVTSSGTLRLHAAEFRSFNDGGGLASFDAATIMLDNRSNGTSVGAVAAPTGTLAFNAGTILLGANTINVDQAATVQLTATNGVMANATGKFVTQGALDITTPSIGGASAINYTIQAAGGALNVLPPAGGGSSAVNSGLGANLTLIGTSITANSNFLLPSGTITLHATAGDLNVGGHIDVTGTAVQFYTEVKYTDGGQINLTADTGSVTLGAASVLNVSANPSGGNAGTIAISAPQGVFQPGGALSGSAGAGGTAGTFSVDAKSIPGGSVTPLDGQLNTGGFTESRTYRVRSGDIVIDGLAQAHTYNLSTDAGSITVGGTGLIDASGVTGGTINLVARDSVTLLNGSVLTVAAQEFDNAGKGGAISLEAGSEINGTVGATTAILDLQTGSTINLTVAANTANSAALGQFTGTLHLRAPQNSTSTDLQVNPINATIIDGIGAVAGTSTITIEGYKIYTPAGGTLNAAVLSSITANGNTFVGTAGAPSATYNLMVNRLFGADPQGLYAKSVILPGAEVINPNGNLTLGTSTATAALGDWNMANLRFGPKKAAGVLTLRAKGNLVFLNSLSDGFASGAYNASLLSPNALLNANVQSWSYRLSSGADFGGADFHDVLPSASLAAGSGSLQLGRDDGANISNSNGSNNAPGTTATTSPAVQGTTGAMNRYQVIRTGSGSIDIAAGGDVQLLNEFAGIYTAGTKTSDPTLGGTFDTPVLTLVGSNQGNLGSVQETPIYPAQYTLAGGNVTIHAQGSIVHQTKLNGTLIDDSSREMPYNWLYRRGFVDPATGTFGKITRIGGAADVGSTSWWVDFQNFFEGVGALGGGNVTMIAGVDVRNVDGLIPTNARMPGKDASNQPIAPNASSLVELGGGDLIVRAGHDINGGVYYVERGNGNLHAGNVITTNSTRTPSLGTPLGQAPADSNNWLPTTLFAGKSTFQVSAAGNVLLGPTVNVFLMPEGFSNTYWDKTYFSTFSPKASVTVSSLGGDVTLRESVSLLGSGIPPTSMPIMEAWLSNISLLSPNNLSFYQPWLRLDEDKVDPFMTTTSIQPGTLKVTSFSGDIDLVGSLNLSPSPTGTLEFYADGGINGLQPAGIGVGTTTSWISGQINLSDASPAAIPGIATPFAYRTTLVAPNNTAANRTTGTNGFLSFIDSFFAETGSTTGSAAGLSTKLALHDPNLLHSGDTRPLQIFANSGDISGLTVFSSKAAQIVAGNDITDIALYVQNLNVSDVSIVSAGRDIIAYDANSVLRAQANSTGNVGDAPRNGDIQISGPGTLEILAGRNLDLGTGAQNSDGTGSGITSIGNARNPSLPSDGANIVVGAGVGQAAVGLANANIDFDAFLKTYLGSGSGPSTGGVNYLAELQDLLGPSFDLSSSTLDGLTAEQKAAVGLQLFYLVLRDAGRDHNDPSKPGFGTYSTGFAAISDLFGQAAAMGDINTRSRDIRTRSGGYINVFAPSGGLKLATATIGNPEIPPGIVTEAGGAISVFTRDKVDIGISRIFTLRGGDIIIWSSEGDIAAGTSAKTVQSAPPTRVVIDPQSANVSTDLAGLATGGGIGVLATVEGVKAGNVDLVAPNGVVDAGDAGIRATGNLNIAATAVLNASNIQVAGSSSGVPAPVAVSAPNIGGLTSANNASAAANSATDQLAKQNQPEQQPVEEPSIITVEVLGYGGGEEATSGDGSQAQ